MLKKALFITAYDRPHYFRETMNSWRLVRGFYDWNVVVRIEPSAVQDHIIAVCNELEHPNLKVIVNPQVYGVLHHPWVGFEELFTGCFYDFVVRAEDDLVVSEDILEYFEWAAEKYYTDGEVCTVLAYTNEIGPLDEVRRTPSFSPWVWGTWCDRWDNFLRNTWDHDYSTYNGYPGNEAGWDWNLNTRIFPEMELKSIVPASSRSQNIGRWGVHGTAENFMESPSFGFTRPQTDYIER